MGNTNTVVAMNESIILPNHETADTAWQEIKAADVFVKKAMSEINAAEKWIVIGIRLNELRETLKRTSSWDKDAPGWHQAFADNRFGMVYATGTKFAVIGEVLGSVSSETERTKLPASWPVLYELASGFKKHPEKLKLAIRDGKITPLMTTKEAKALAGKKPDRRKGKVAKPSKVTPMKNFETKRNEYIKAAKILSPQECEKEIVSVAKALHPKSAKAPNRTFDELGPQITALLGKMNYRKRLHALDNLATYIVKQFPELEIRVSQAMSSIKIGGK